MLKFLLIREIKTDKQTHGSNTLTDNQKKFLQNAANVGFAVSVCYSAKEAISAIQAYYDQETMKGTTQDLPFLKTQNKAYSECCCESH